MTSTPQAAPTRPRPRLGDLANSRHNNFDFIRLVLSFFVIITHSYIITQGKDDNDPFLWLTRGQIQIATLAVNYFFVISGFLICASWQQTRSTTSYFRKRLLRIYPAFIVAILFALFIVGPLGSDDPQGYLKSWKTYSFFFRELLFHKDPTLGGTLMTGGTPNLPLGSAATLRYEVGAYVMVALMGLLGLLQPRFRWFHLILFGTSIALYNLIHPKWEVPFFGGLGGYTPRLTAYFLAGMMFYLFRHHIPHSRLLFAACAILLAVSSRLGVGLHWILPVCATYIIFHFAYSRSINLHSFAKYGDFSYGVFLYGYPVQQLLWHYFPQVQSPEFHALAAIVISCGLAALSWHLVEKPFLKLRPKAPVALSA